VPARDFHQRQVATMQIAHGRHKGNALGLCEELRQFRGRSGDLHSILGQ
jgi:hypothetical protein